MPEPVYRTYLFIAQLVAFLPIGTNQGIAHLLWAILSGKLLSSRGAIFPALSEAGLNEQQSRRAEATLRQGKVKIARLLERFLFLIRREHKSVPLQIGKYSPLLIDWVGFTTVAGDGECSYRPHLKGCVTRHFASTAGKALPAIEIGMVARCLTIGVRRIPMLCGLIRSGKTFPLLQEACAIMRANKQGNDVLIADRQVKISHIEAGSISRFVIRGAIDFTARTKEIPKTTGRGRKPAQGRIVRPLVRTYKDKVIAATVADREESFVHQGRTVTASWFDNLVVPGCALCFHCVVICDPKYKTPWLLLTDLSESAQIIFELYRSRWKIEMLPQTSKQLLGSHRSFVHAEESRFRLPELCLIAASICLYLSATSKAIATGFWDKYPKPTPGRFRRSLSNASLPDVGDIANELRTLPGFSGKVDKILSRVRSKHSVYEHLPVGVMAHCRQKSQQSYPSLTGN